MGFCVDQQGAAGREQSFTAKHGLLVECRYREVPIDSTQMTEAVVVQAEIAGQVSGLFGSRAFDTQHFHDQSLTSLRSPMNSSLGALGSSTHLMRSTPSVTSLIVPQKLIRR